MWISLAVTFAVLLTFVIKSQAFTVDDLTVKTKENAIFSVMSSKQQPLNLNLDQQEACRTGGAISSFSPQNDQELSSFGGTFKGVVHWSPYLGNLGCGFAYGPVIGGRIITSGCSTSDGSLVLCYGHPATQEAIFSLRPWDGLFDRSVHFQIGGKPMLIKQSGQYTDFSLRDWIRFKVIESALGKECARDRSKCPTSPPRKYYTTTTNGGIRG
jgi:hypothetical protein